MSEPTAPAPPLRDYLVEAQFIVAGRSLVVPERGHLVAVQHQLNRAIEISTLQNRALIALLLTVKQVGFVVPVDVIRDIEARHLDLSISRQQGGPIEIGLMEFKQTPTRRV